VEHTRRAEWVWRQREEGLLLTILNRLEKLILEDFDFYASELLWRFTNRGTDRVVMQLFERLPRLGVEP
jgi:hypothetical protein